MTRFLTILALTLAPFSAFAAPFYVGTWAGPNISCDAVNTDAVPRRITQTTVYGYESSCELTNPINIRDMNGMLFDLVCSGEGEQWTERVLYILNEDGTLTSHTRGWTSISTRCN